MMDGILRELLDLQGVHASLVFDNSGQILAFQGSSIYDRPLLEGASGLLAKALDSVELLHADWDNMQARFGDGSLMIRSLGALPNQGGRAALAVLADNSLNRSFATVAMRVGVQKLKQALANFGAAPSQSVPPAMSGYSMPSRPSGMAPPLPPPPPPAAYPQYQAYPHQTQMMHGGHPHGGHPHASHPHQPQPPAQPTAPWYPPAPPAHGGPGGSNLDGTDYNASGLSRSQLGGSGFGGAPAPRPGASAMGSGLAWSGVGGSQGSSMGVAVADEESLEMLTKLTKALAPFVGPMAKVFVKEAVRDVCREVPFGAAHAQDVARVLKSHIEYDNDREQFVKTARSIVGAT